MRITDVETIRLVVDRAVEGRPLKFSWYITKVHTDEGLVGVGRGGGPLVGEHLRPLVVGEDPRCPERVWARMYEAATRFRGPGRSLMAAIGAVDVAVWDVFGRAVGQPIYRLLGGFRDRVPVYADGIGDHYPTAEDVARKVAEYVGRGFKAVKVHLLGEAPEQAVEKVRRSREAAGEGFDLMIDVARFWDTESAIRAVKLFEPYRVCWLEEPIRWDDELRGLAALSAATTIPIAAGESEGTLYACRELIVRGGVRIVQADTVLAGGFTALRKIAALADAYHGKIAPHGASYPEVCAHVVAAFSNGLIVSAFPGHEPYQIWTDLYREPLEVEDGWIAMPQRPGLGMELDEDFIRAHRAG